MAATVEATLSAGDVPVFRDLPDVYGASGAKESLERYRAIAQAFQTAFGAAPDLYARAPGRVNLIGEHIDYEGYGVLPMAIKQDTIVAIRKAGDVLDLRSLEHYKYGNITFDMSPNQKVDVNNHSWANYFLAAYKGVYDHLAASGRPTPPPCGLQVLVHGTVPTAAGLSSSSALVCASAVAILGVHGVHCGKAQVAEFACECERYVGVTSGGMDQAIAMMAQLGVAKHVEFHPVRAADVMLPDGAAFVIANSLAESAKALTAAERYNMRVVECRLAAAVLARSLGKSQAEACAVRTLREVESMVDAAQHGDISTACIAVVQTHLHDHPYPQAEIEELLGEKVETLLDNNAASLQTMPVAARNGGFKLRQRAQHVYTEAARVLQFRDTCNDVAMSNDDKLRRLGELMSASHESCAVLYECSCAELDEIVKLAREFGAVGSRLTGAGWGGCTVSLVTQQQSNDFVAYLKEKYYAKLIESGHLKAEDVDKCVFATLPSNGAAVLKLAGLDTVL